MKWGSEEWGEVDRNLKCLWWGVDFAVTMSLVIVNSI